MKVTEKEVSLTFMYDNPEEAQNHIEEMKSKGWIINQKYTPTWFKFLKQKKIHFKSHH